MSYFYKDGNGPLKQCNSSVFENMKKQLSPYECDLCYGRFININKAYFAYRSIDKEAKVHVELCDKCLEPIKDLEELLEIPHVYNKIQEKLTTVLPTHF